MQLSIRNACLALAEKLIRLGALSRATPASFAPSRVRPEKTATLCVPLSALALRKVLPPLIWFSPWTSFVWQSTVLERAAPLELIRVRTFIISRPLSPLVTLVVSMSCS